MYKCNECKELFDEPDSYRENVGEFWGQPAYQTFYICPYCGSDDFDEYEEEMNECDNKCYRCAGGGFACPLEE